MEKVKVHIENKQKAFRVPTGMRLLMRRCCHAVLELEGFAEDAEVDISIVDNEQIRRINNEQRHIDLVTDVLSFPLGENGVYDKDPHKYPDAKKYETLTFTKVLEDRLAVMDGTAATLCRDNKLPILVFDLADPDNIARAVQGENVGTLVYEG